MSQVQSSLPPSGAKPWSTRRAFCRIGALALGGGIGLPVHAAGGATAGPRYAGHPALAPFAAGVAERRQLPERWVLGRLEQARRNDTVRRLVMPPPPGTARNWRAYRERFVERDRITAGLAFWRQHEPWLAQAEAAYGVPPEVVVGIVGVETYYGRVMGRFRIVDALATLAFDFPSGRSDRSTFFRGELEEFFVWCAREGVDPLAPLGSYAGAMGLPQFMPSSLNRHAVDFDTDGRTDLVGSGADAVGSVARYLAHFGWQPGMATHYAVQPPSQGDALPALRANDISPAFTAAQLQAQGVTLPEPARSHDGLLAFVELENGGGPASHYAGTANFYVITRYNRSSYYALAVSELAQAVKGAKASR
ncbi:MAG: lytic murein transglycosylase B [Rubrivivax sp.]|nr:lytic murein transglycosylase B [Rubrivivax sp.]